MLLTRIEHHLRNYRISQSRFGREAVGDPCLISDLRDGRELRRRTEARVCAYLDAAEREQPSCSR